MAPLRIVLRPAGGTGDPQWGRPRGPETYDAYGGRPRRLWRPPTDVYETDDSLMVKVEIPGMRDDGDFVISFADRRLTIAGQRRDRADKIGYHNMEIRYGEFRTEVHVDWALDETAIEATYEDGFLYVRLPRAREYRVPVNVAAPEQPRD